MVRMRNKVAVESLPREKRRRSVYESVVFTPETSRDLLPFRPGKVEGVLWKALRPNHDERGWLCELFRQDDMPAEQQPAMAYLSQTLPGATRGPHEHLQQTDSFCFFGPTTFHLYLWDHRVESSTYLCHEVAILGRNR